MEIQTKPPEKTKPENSYRISIRNIQNQERVLVQRELTVKKFGGTSVGSLDRIEKIADLLTEDFRQGQLPAAVVSAVSGETNRLIKLGAQVFPSFRGPAYDMLLASGEQVSVALLSMALEKRGLKTAPLLGHQAGIQTDALFSRARIKTIQTDCLKEAAAAGRIPLIAGFQGVTAGRRITTLGRGGSDLTAVALAVALKRELCEIYTDVDGVFTGDPRLIPSARKTDRLEFAEMMEMAGLGAKVLQPRSVELAAKNGIKIHVRHAFKKTGGGTWILPDKTQSPPFPLWKKNNMKRNNMKKTAAKPGAAPRRTAPPPEKRSPEKPPPGAKGAQEASAMESSVVSAIAHDSDIAVIQIKKVSENLVADLFRRLGRESVSVDMIFQAETAEGRTLAFSIHQEDAERTLRAVKALVSDRKRISLIKNTAKISVVGVGMAHHAGVAGRFFSVLQKAGAGARFVTTSEIKISAIIDKKFLKQTARRLHKAFGLENVS